MVTFSTHSLWETGQEYEIVPVGIGVYGLTGRMEKSYRLMGAELESEYNPVEAGLARPKVKAADFIGKDAYLRMRDEDLSTFVHLNSDLRLKITFSIMRESLIKPYSL